MKILIVDDEAPARRRLRRLLAAIEDAEVVGEAKDGNEALDLIDELVPDVVLLDIHMPGLDGLAVARSGGDLPPIVFTTAYEQHALEAFDVAAVDYLLKPIEPERLAEAITRARRLSRRKLSALLEQVVHQSTELPRITARHGTSIRVLDPRKLTRFHSADRYTIASFEGDELVLDDSLSELEQRLSSYNFMRVHRSELINLEHVTAVHSDAGTVTVELNDGQRAQVSRRMLAALRKRLGV